VMVVIDVSRSMGARDVAPSRLEATKTALAAALARLGGERVGVVVFGGDARLRFPMTSDLSAAVQVIRGLEPGLALVDGGTSTTSGLDIALASFDDSREAGKLIVLVSDGDDLGGDPAATARRIRESGVALLIMGAGTRAGATVPVYDARTKSFVDKKGPDGKPIVSVLNETFLVALASAAGGTYLGNDFTALPAAVTGRVAALDRADIASRRVDIPVERFQWFAGAALGLVVLLTGAEWLGSSLRRRGGLAVVAVGALWMAACATDSYTINEEGRRALGDGDVETAVERFYAAEAAAPGDTAIILNLSGALVRAGRFDEATRAARRALLVGGRDDRVRAFDLIGHARFGAGDLAGSLDAFRQSLLVDPANDRARHDYEVVLRLLYPGEEPGNGGDQGGQPGSDAGPGDGVDATPSPDAGGPGQQPGAGGTPGVGATPPPPGGQPGSQGLPGSPEALARRLAEIDSEIAALLDDGEIPTAAEAAEILDLLAERSRIVALRDAFEGNADPRDY